MFSFNFPCFPHNFTCFPIILHVFTQFHMFLHNFTYFDIILHVFTNKNIWKKLALILVSFTHIFCTFKTILWKFLWLYPPSISNHQHLPDPPPPAADVIYGQPLIVIRSLSVLLSSRPKLLLEANTTQRITKTWVNNIKWTNTNTS